MGYLPQDHTASNKPYGVTGKPDGARAYFYDKGNTFAYRQFTTIQQILDYFNTPSSRIGQFPIILNTGGTVEPDGSITGGTNDEYWFRDGIEDEDLVLRTVSVDLSNYYTIEQTDELIENLQTQIDTMIENRKPIPIVALADTPTVINWQTALVPNDDYGRTYVGRFGNIIQDIINYYEDMGTTYKGSPEFTYTKNGNSINVVTFAPNTLQTGTISIL